MKTKLFLLILFVLCIVCINELQSQELISLELQATEINGNTFDNYFNVTITNNSLDTIFIALEPFEFETIGKSNMVFANMSYNKFAPGRIVFFVNPSTRYLEGSSGSNISFLRFPHILTINSGSKAVLLLKFEDATKDLLIGNNWDIYCELWYAFNNDIKYAFNLKKDIDKTIKEQFEKSLLCVDTIKVNVSILNLRDNNPILISDSSLYLYKEGEKVKESYLTDYDYIISFFKNQIHNYINRK